jgi:hypothetical protein
VDLLRQVTYVLFNHYANWLTNTFSPDFLGRSALSRLE